MSDPVTNMAIEDVLSSIRRLVSEGDRPAKIDIFAPAPPGVPLAAAVPVPLAVAQSPVIPDKFLLTPALRITDTADLPRVPALIAPLAPQLAPPRHAPPQLVRTTPPLAESRSALEQRIAELEAAVADQSDDWEPDGSEEVPVVDWAAAQSADGFVFASRAMPQPDRSGALDLGKVGTRIHPVIDEDFGAAAAPAAPHPAGATQPYHLGEDLDLSAASDAEHDLAAYLDGPDLDDGEPDQDGVQHEFSQIAPEALRQMVVEIVRQELQGPLGERITRNVRKMVRREIYRVLSSQELGS